MPPKEARSCPHCILCQLQVAFLGFLIFNIILSDLFLVETDGVYAVPLGPEMIAPREPVLQMLKLFEYPNGCASFDSAAIVRH